MSQLLRAASVAGRRLVRPPSSSLAATMVHGLRRSMASSSATTRTARSLRRSMASSPGFTRTVHSRRPSMASSAAATAVHGSPSMAPSCRCRETMEGRWMITLAKWGLICTVGNAVVDMKVEKEATSIREEMLSLEEDTLCMQHEMLLLHASNAELQASNAELQELMEPYIARWRANKEEN